MKIFYCLMFFSCLLYASRSSGQEINFSTMTGRPVSIATVSRIQEPYYFVYDSIYKSGALYRNEFKKSTPEELLTSLFSSPDIVTLNTHFLVTPINNVDENVLKRRTRSDTVTNYFLPIHKLTYLEAGKEHVILKYHEIIASKKDKLYSLHAIKVEGDFWKIQSINSNDDLDYLMRVVQPAAFRSLKTSTIPKDDFMKDIHLRTRADMGVLNISKLAILIREWEEKSFTEHLSKVTDL